MGWILAPDPKVRDWLKHKSEDDLAGIHEILANLMATKRPRS